MDTTILKYRNHVKIKRKAKAVSGVFLRYIDTKEELADFIEHASHCSVLAIDTEFIREKSYYPQLCLLQMAADDQIVVIDPIAIEDISDIRVLLENREIVKLFHAGRQDIEILFRATSVTPAPVFDTQIAAALLGHSHQVGLGSLVSSFCGVSLKKGDSFTDWSRRPLAASQLAYAADDVAYLGEIYTIMKTMLEEKGRLSWLDEDFETLSDPGSYIVDPYSRYKRLKRGNQLNRHQLSAARELAAWREIKAQERDIPRKWVLTDEQIVEACKREPKNIDELFLIRGIREHLPTKDAREVVSLMQKGYSLPEQDWPKVEQNNSNEPNVDQSIDLMLALARLRAKENGIALQTLVSQSELASVARGHLSDVPVMQGWRRAIVGGELLDLLSGRIVLGLDDNELVVTRRSQL